MPPTITRILFATALSERSAWTLRHVIALSAATGAEIRILHVIEALSEDARVTLLAFIQDDVQRTAALSQRLELTRQHLAERQERFWSSLPPEEQKIRDRVVATDVVEGFPAEVILNEATRHHCDLIVLGAHERAITHRFLGDTANRVLRHSAIPTLIVPYHPQQQPEKP